MSYFKRYWTFYTSKLFQIFPKNLIVILGGQNWLIPYIYSPLTENVSNLQKKSIKFIEKSVQIKKKVKCLCSPNMLPYQTVILKSCQYIFIILLLSLLGKQHGSSKFTTDEPNSCPFELWFLSFQKEMAIMIIKSLITCLLVHQILN